MTYCIVVKFFSFIIVLVWFSFVLEAEPRNLVLFSHFILVLVIGLLVKVHHDKCHHDP